MRTRQCRLIGTAICLDVAPIRLDLKHWRVEYATGTAITTGEDLLAFAQLDGFPSFPKLVEFWREHHPKIDDTWEGVRISWTNFALAV